MVTSTGGVYHSAGNKLAEPNWCNQARFLQNHVKTPAALVEEMGVALKGPNAGRNYQNMVKSD